MGASERASDCFASQFCNFEFSESGRRALVRSSALCARQWQLWPPMGPFPLKFEPRAHTQTPEQHLQSNELPFTDSCECHNVLHEFSIIIAPEEGLKIFVYLMDFIKK